jgi:hypothetical protein
MCERELCVNVCVCVCVCVCAPPPSRGAQNALEKHVPFELLQSDGGHMGQQRGVTPSNNGSLGHRGVTPNGSLGAPSADLPGE